MDRNMSSKGCSEVKQVAVSTLQEKNILQKQQSFVNKITRIYSPLWRITSPFIRLLIFSFVYNVKFYFKRKNPLHLNFISSRRIRVKQSSKIISLQDSAAVYEVTPLKATKRIDLFLPPRSTLLFLPLFDGKIGQDQKIRLQGK